MNKSEVAKLLLDIGCLELSPSRPFTYASGLKGPIYCDNRKLLSNVNERNKIIDAFVGQLDVLGWKYDQIAGLATAGIPYASIIAEKKNEPMVYVRSKPKAHGKRQQVEGSFEQGQRLVLFEDLVNQGASLNEALLGVQDSGLEAAGCMAIVHYQTPKANEVIEKWSLNFSYLTDIHAICDTALELNLITNNERELLRDWNQDPKGWSDNFNE